VHLVQPLRDALGQAAGVREDDRRTVGADQVEELRVDRGPHRVASLGGRHRRFVAVGRVGHVFDRDEHLEVELLRLAGVDDPDFARRADQDPADLVDGALRCGKPDALEGPAFAAADEVLEPFERQGEVCAALGAGDGVDLVHDDPSHGPKDLAGA
jgi:hypothetical protein